MLFCYLAYVVLCSLLVEAPPVIALKATAMESAISDKSKGFCLSWLVGEFLIKLKWAAVLAESENS